MALFPAFAGIRSGEDSTHRELDWLKNESFCRDEALRLHQHTAERDGTSPDTALQKPDVEDEYEPKFKKKRKKEKKKKKHKKQKKRNRVRSESSTSGSDTVYPSDLKKEEEEEELTERAEACVEESSFRWLDDLQSITQRLFCIDRTADHANWQYKSLYRAHIPRYKRKGSSALGLDSRTQAVCWEDSAPDKKRKDRGPERYFSPSVCQLLCSEALPTVPNAPAAPASASSFIPLSTGNEEQHPAAHSSASGFNPLGIYDSSTCLWLEGKGQKEVKSEVGQTPADSAAPLIGRVEEFNRKLRDSPSDINLWKEFIDFQDELSSAGGVFAAPEAEVEARRLSVRALLERKVSIVEKALESNPGSVELKLERLRLCRELWEPAALLKEWKKLVFVHPNSATLWRKYILFTQSHFSSFSVSKVNAAYGKCLSTLSAVQDGSMVSHPPLPGTEESMLDIFLQQCHFLRQAGHTEKAVSLFQALLDFTFFKPDNVKDLPTKQQVEFFEPFWDSGEPRVGERGARGWRAWMLQQERGGWLIPPEPEEEEDEEPEDSEIKDKMQPKWKIWLDVETSREAKHWLPWRPDKAKGQSEEDCEDPDRQVLFDDLCPSMIRLDSAELRLRFLLSFLQFLGLPASSATPPHSLLLDDLRLLEEGPDPEHPLTSYDLPLTGVGAVGHMTYLRDSRRSAGLCKDGEEFVKNVLEQTLPLFPPQDRAVLSLCWLRYEKLKVLRCVRSRNKRSIKSQGKRSKRVAKGLLKQQENRGSLALWREYGHLEWLLGNVEESRRVFDTALALAGARGLRQHALCDLCLLYAQLEVEQMSRGGTENSETAPTTSRAVHILTGLAEGAAHTPFSGRVSPVAVLRGRKAYEQALSSCLQALGEAGRSAGGGRGERVSGLVGCFGLFQYLTMGIEAADAVFAQARQTLTSVDSGSEGETISLCHAALLRYHASTAAFPLSRLRSTLTEALQRLPCSAPLWQLYLLTESRYQWAGRARRFFYSVTKTSQSVIPHLFAVMAEQRRKEVLDSVRRSGLAAEVLPIVPETGLSNRIRSLFEAAVATEHGAHCPLLWRMYMNFMVSNGDTERGIGVFYKALQDVPWAKGLFMDAVQLYPDRVQEFLDLVMEKELRLRAPMEEVDILLED